MAGSEADYDDPGALRRAFDGAAAVLFVSAHEAAHRLAQHVRVVDAAAASGVGHTFLRDSLYAEALPEAYASRSHYGAPDWEVAGWGPIATGGFPPGSPEHPPRIRRR